MNSFSPALADLRTASYVNTPSQKREDTTLWQNKVESIRRICARRIALEGTKAMVILPFGPFSPDSKKKMQLDVGSEPTLDLHVWHDESEFERVYKLKSLIKV